MIKKSGKVKSQDFKTVKKPVKVVRGDLLSVRVFKNANNSKSKFSFIVSKKVEKKAVLRNKIRRMGFAALGDCMGLAPEGFMFIFNFNKAPVSKEEVELFLANLFKEKF